MKGAQEARLGMDLALEILYTLYEADKGDPFNEAFMKLCEFSGLFHRLEFKLRKDNIYLSLEAQSAVTVVLTVAQKMGNLLAVNSWKVCNY